MARAQTGRPRVYCTRARRSRAHQARTRTRATEGLVRLYRGDAFAFLAGLPDESVDLVLTDPPYRFDRGNMYFREVPDAPR